MYIWTRNLYSQSYTRLIVPDRKWYGICDPTEKVRDLRTAWSQIPMKSGGSYFSLERKVTKSSRPSNATLKGQLFGLIWLQGFTKS